MLALAGYFSGMFGWIQPPEDRLELAQTLPDKVRAHIVASEKVMTVGDDPKTHLAGSYARFTGVDDIKDVDILVFVDASYEGEDPDVVLDALAEALKGLEVDGYGKGEVKTKREQRRSHHVEFRKGGEEAFHIDVVPVIRYGDDKMAILRIPDREWTRWDNTQPIGYAESLTSLNWDNNHKVRKTIRMLKRIRNVHLKSSARPKSYWLEAKVYDLWRQGRLSKDDSYADLIFDMIKEIRRDCGPTPLRIPDPQLRHNLTDSWEQQDYGKFVVVLDDLIETLESIEDEADSDRAVVAWKHVFGDDAFRLSDEAEKALSEATKVANAASVTKVGIVVPASSGLGTPSPAHRFYGEV